MKPETLSSKHLANAVEQMSKLPGVGFKTALRHILHLLNHPSQLENFIESLNNLKKIKRCKICHNLSDNDICEICADKKRDHSTICVVEDVKDIIAIENTHQYHGVYHVLGGLISPIDGIAPENLNINSLEKRIQQNSIKEIIFALNTTMEGDTTAFYLFRTLKKYNVKITSIARGIGFGDEIEYTDEITLAKALENRTEFKE